MGAMSPVTYFLLSACLVLPSCGGDEDACPAGFTRQHGRCLGPGQDAGADAGGEVDCSVGEGVGQACTGDEQCPCGPCVELGGRRACTSRCDDGQTCRAGWGCGDDGVCTCTSREETCNLRDDDCDGAIDDDATGAAEWYPDEDGDGFGARDGAVTACEPPEGTIATGGDCDDASGARHPGATEVCDGLDDDCDDVLPADEVDDDDDGAPQCADCADEDATRHPGAAEACNGVDDDCDGAVPADEADGDGDTVRVCADDCADDDAARHPGAPEACNGLDDDCDGAVPADEADGDGDSVRVCAGDCADDDGARHPGALEACNGVDDDCSGAVPADEADADGDTFRICAGDCADDDPARYPGAPERCNGLDDDCANGVPADEANADGDPARICDGDCMDDNRDVYPGQNAYFDVDRGDGSYDYNCDDVETMRHTSVGCAAPDLAGHCATDYWCTSLPACGERQYRVASCLACNPSCDLTDDVQTCR